MKNMTSNFKTVKIVTTEKYIVIIGILNSIEDFTESVNQHLKQGWFAHGNVSLYDGQILQSLSNKETDL